METQFGPYKDKTDEIMTMRVRSTEHILESYRENEACSTLEKNGVVKVSHIHARISTQWAIVFGLPP